MGSLNSYRIIQAKELLLIRREIINQKPRAVRGFWLIIAFNLLSGIKNRKKTKRRIGIESVQVGSEQVANVLKENHFSSHFPKGLT